MLSVRWQPATEMILRIRKSALAYLDWFLILCRACVGSSSQRCRKMTVKGKEGWTSHPLSSSMFGHPHFHWGCNHNDYMRNLNPHALYESLWMETWMCRCVSKCVSLSLLYTEYQNTHSTSKVRTLQWQWGQCGWSPQLQRLWPGFSLGLGTKLGAG